MVQIFQARALPHAANHSSYENWNLPVILGAALAPACQAFGAPSPCPKMVFPRTINPKQQKTDSTADSGVSTLTVLFRGILSQSQI